MAAIELLVTEFAITISHVEVWLSIGLALLLGAGCLSFGTWVARTVGLLRSDAPVGETLGVGLASGLVVLAAWWAAISSGGRSSFTVVAVGFAIAIGLALARRARRPRASVSGRSVAGATPKRRRSAIFATLASGLFIVLIALLYGSTMAPSPRDGVQPVEFNDVAFYAVLGRDLATTGTETNLSASGFSEFPGISAQTWYHWGETWLAAAVISLLGVTSMASRYLIVLPIVLLAAAAMTGTIARRVGATSSRRVFVFGFLACLFLAPLPVLPGPFFSSWAAGMIFGITLYGLGAVAIPLAIYGLATLGGRDVSWGLAAFVGTAAAFILPAHLAVALLALLGIASVSALRIGRSLVATGRLPSVPAAWQRLLIASGVVSSGTVAWGLLTDHLLGGGVGVPPIVEPFSASWRDSVAITFLGGGALLTIPFAWFIVRTKRPFEADLYLGAMAILVGGAAAWGARLGEFTMFYLFFGGIAVIATPVAAVAVRTVWARLKTIHRPVFAACLLVLFALQLELGAVNALLRLQSYGAQSTNWPIPIALLEEIRQLPRDAKLAYTCRPLDESGFAVPQLLTIDAHANRRVIPMCFEAEVLSTLLGAERSDQVPNLFFYVAPQYALYPSADARPTAAAVSAFLRQHGIAYIYADAFHPNSLVPEAVPVAAAGGAQVLRVP